MSDDWEEIGKLVERRRDERQWTQPQLAKQAGISLSSVGEIERGKRRRRHRKTLELVFGTLNFTPDQIKELTEGCLPEEFRGQGAEPTEISSALEMLKKCLEKLDALEKRQEEFDRKQAVFADVLGRIDSRITEVIELDEYSHPGPTEQQRSPDAKIDHPVTEARDRT